MKAVYKLNFDCGRQGELTGLFIEEKERVEILCENKIEIHFGEVLGKHSDISGPIDDGEIIFVTDNQDVIKVLEEHELTTGYNPFWYSAINYYDLIDDEEIDDLTVGELCDMLLAKKH